MKAVTMVMATAAVLVAVITGMFVLTILAEVTGWGWVCDIPSIQADRCG